MTAPPVLRHLIVAIQFMTRVPMPRLANVTNGEFAAAIRWFPAAGLVVGVIVADLAWLGARIDPWVGALAGLIGWVAATGGLHLDGLGDLADARGAAHGDRDRFLAVLADPHIGSWGVIAIVVQLLAKLVLLHAVILAGWLWPVVAIAAAARIGPLWWSRALPPLGDGLAARFVGTVRPWHMLLWLVPLGAVCWRAPALAVAPLLILLWGWWLRRTVGGINGDCHGAGIELVETGLLLALLVGDL